MLEPTVVVNIDDEWLAKLSNKYDSHAERWLNHTVCFNVMLYAIFVKLHEQEA